MRASVDITTDSSLFILFVFEGATHSFPCQVELLPLTFTAIVYTACLQEKVNGVHYYRAPWQRG